MSGSQQRHLRAQTPLKSPCRVGKCGKSWIQNTNYMLKYADRSVYTLYVNTYLGATTPVFVFKVGTTATFSCDWHSPSSTCTEKILTDLFLSRIKFSSRNRMAILRSLDFHYRCTSCTLELLKILVSPAFLLVSLPSVPYDWQAGTSILSLNSASFSPWRQGEGGVQEKKTRGVTLWEM